MDKFLTTFYDAISERIPYKAPVELTYIAELQEIMQKNMENSEILIMYQFLC